jgi:hypothetical protein
VVLPGLYLSFWFMKAWLRNACDIKRLEGWEEGEKLWERLILAIVLALFRLTLAMASGVPEPAPLTIIMLKLVL